MLLTVGLSATCPKRVPPNQADMPRLWAALPNLEGSFIVRPFIGFCVDADRPSCLSRVPPPYPPQPVRKPRERIEGPRRPTRNREFLSNHLHARHKSGS